MKKLYPPTLLVIILVLASLLPQLTFSQACSSLTATYNVLESRCAATGSIKINASGGTGNYQYKVTGPVTTSYTSSNIITGLSAGSYQVTVLDIGTNCTYVTNSVAVPGNYITPGFTMKSTGITCPNAHDGTISLVSENYGRAPFSYKIISPSPSQVGVVSTTGDFTGLTSGNYLIQLTDSCGAIQTRSIAVDNYDWFINTTTVINNGCDKLDITIKLKDIFSNTTPNAIFNGYQYGATSTPGDTTWSATNSFTYYLGTKRSATLLVKDNCGNIKSVVWNNTLIPKAYNTVTISNKACSTFTAKVEGQANLTSPEYCLYNSSNALISCGSSPVFSNILYGSYCIKITDHCYDTTFSRCFTVNSPVPTAGAVVTTTTDCLTFSVSVSGGSNLNNPGYCLIDANNVTLACNLSGSFSGLNYGGAGNSYCIRIKNNPACYDTTMKVCFPAVKPIPSVNPVVNLINGCSTFDASIFGKLNLTNPYYCLYDALGNLISCDSTGNFSGLSYGSYCIKIKNDPACYDTTIIRCFTGIKQIPGLGGTVNTTNFTCNTFDANTTGATNLTNPQYCLYTAATDSLIGCNTTGQFTGIPYGSYCIKVQNDATCYDTLFKRCFTVNKKIPSVGNNAIIDGRTCTGFTATITAQSNLNNPQFCIYDSLDVLISCNSTGVFTGMDYGNYCIKIKNDSDCYDTTITRCISVVNDSLAYTMSVKPSCSAIGATTITASVYKGSPAYNFSLYAPGDDLVESAVSPAGHNFLNIPDLPSGEQYKLVITDQCGRKDSTYITTVPSRVNRAFSMNSYCPSSTSPSGYSDVVIDITDHNLYGATIISKIVKMNGTDTTINPYQVSGYVYTYPNLKPGTYIFQTFIQDCSNYLYDTIAVKPYIYPNLYGSQAYQCDNNSFTVGASTTDGKGPYLYEIFGSLPDSPSIVAPPQANPVFSINTGTSYSLIRLRVVDACGNASLTDVSVLPLANFIVYPNKNECFDEDLTLFVDSIPNATYEWYKRINDDDSVLVGNSSTYYISDLLIQDTGRYFCKVVVNNGCLIKYANYIITGFCNTYLPVDITLKGNKQANGNTLFWEKISDHSITYKLQRSTKTNSAFKDVNTIDKSTSSEFVLLDNDPPPGNNYYRVKIINKENQIRYSNSVLIKNKKFDISLYPNPVHDILYISVSNSVYKDYQVEIINPAGKIISSKVYKKILNTVISYPKEYNMNTGIYFVTITDINTNEKEIFKVMFN